FFFTFFPTHQKKKNQLSFSLITRTSTIYISAISCDFKFQSCGESSYEELTLLSRHNQIFGLQDVVKKVVGLGGRHWLVSKVLFEASKFSKLTSSKSNSFHNKQVM
ncbi:hypothetical protein GIB67_028736, partial [Kingdonia uniflora]